MTESTIKNLEQRIKYLEKETTVLIEAVHLHSDILFKMLPSAKNLKAMDHHLTSQTVALNKVYESL